MTKTLTEQWREGTLPEGYYYTKLNDDDGTIDMNYCWDDGCFQDYCDNMVDEVLAPVPSYEKVQKLKEQIKEANECIKDKYLWTCSACSLLGSCMSCGNRYFGRYIKKWGVE